MLCHSSCGHEVTNKLNKLRTNWAWVTFSEAFRDFQPLFSYEKEGRIFRNHHLVIIVSNSFLLFRMGQGVWMLHVIETLIKVLALFRGKTKFSLPTSFLFPSNCYLLLFWFELHFMRVTLIFMQFYAHFIRSIVFFASLFIWFMHSRYCKLATTLLCRASPS